MRPRFAQYNVDREENVIYFLSLPGGLHIDKRQEVLNFPPMLYWIRY